MLGFMYQPLLPKLLKVSVMNLTSGEDHILNNISSSICTQRLAHLIFIWKVLILDLFFAGLDAGLKPAIKLKVKHIYFLPL